MLKSASVVTLALGLVHTLGCGDSHFDDDPYCADDDGLICEPEGLTFVNFALTRSDACASGDKPSGCSKPASDTETTLTSPEPGKVCLKGSVVGRDGWATLILGLGGWNKSFTAATSSLDAKKLGITDFTFELESPPSTGLQLAVTSLSHTRCPEGPPSCLATFDLSVGDRSNGIKTFTEAGPQRAPLEDFTGDDPQLKPNTSKLHDLVFVVAPGDFDFCVTELKLLNADGEEVEP